MKENDDSITRTGSGDAIPVVVLKNITYALNGNHYGVSLVIHNQINTKRICNRAEGWGWPEHNDNNESINLGGMYYCSIQSEQLKPFNLNEIKPKGTETILEMIQLKRSSRHTEEETPKQI